MERPLFWHQGLFLQPQHFQLQDQYSQSLMAPYNKFLCPHFWGIKKTEIHTAALGNFSFNLMSGEFMFQDMTYVSLPGNAVVSARSFDDAWSDGGKPFNVYVGLKNYSSSKENVTVLPNLDDISEVTTRFVTISDPEEIPDLHQGGPVAQVKGLYYALKIFWETEVDQLGDYSLLPVTRLERSGDEVIISNNFIPPSLAVSSSDALLKLVTELRDQISSRSHQLEEYKREKGLQSAEFGAKDMVFLMALRSLNRYVPVLFHLTETSHVHPWSVYGLLRQLVGELSTFSGQVNVKGEGEDGRPLLSKYNHRDLWECFSGALSLVTMILDEITSGPEHVLNLMFDGTYFGTELSPAVFEGRNRFFLVIDTEADPASALQSLTTSGKIGSRESLPILIARALPGITLEHLETPPQELPRRTRSIYFQIDHHSDQWAQVQKNGNIALYWDDAPGDLKAELMVVGRT
jgi:type VI secretion system protein ImpJ